MKNNAMLDLETLGQRPGAVIVSLGAVKFGADGPGEEFYRRIDAESCLGHGLTMDAATVLWWLKQSDAARAEIALPGLPLGEVLQEFAGWLNAGSADHEMKIWGNGASFDNAMLAAAYHAAAIPLPWKYYNDRCYRTVKKLYPQHLLLQDKDTKHNALEDAKAQAQHLIAIAGAEKINLI